MLKVRVIPCLTIKDLRLVKSIQFANHRNIGSYIAAVRVFNTRDVDEMIVLDLDGYETGPKLWLLEEITKECFMPLTIGGGIKNIEHIRSVLKIGADKISINTAALNDPSFINRAAETFGRQCIVVSMMNGYDIDLIRAVSEAVSIPVIVSGGAGTINDFVSAIKEGSAAALAAASIFQYTQITPMQIKQNLLKNSIPARI